MASFTDKPFDYNPYISTTPVQAMVAVGMEKERQFKGGIEKAQSYIDSIAGLDILKEEDKKFVSQKLGEVRDGIAKNLSGDFSDDRIVNQIGGAAKYIFKNPTVQNAVVSTSNVRKGMADMDAAIKGGKSSVANEWDYQTQVDAWLKDGKAGTLFNGKYSPFSNYRKNALDVIKALTKDESITDNAFTTDSRGNLVISDAIVRKKLAGISPEKIQQAIMAGLNPDDFRQMQIDGRYNYSNLAPQEFVERLNDSYGDKVGFFEKQRQVLVNAKSSTNSAVEKTNLDNQIASLDKVINNVKGEYASISETLENGDVESAKARLHTTNFINGFSKAFSYTEASQTYQDSPFAQMAFKREEKAQNWKKFMLEYSQKESHFQTDKAIKLEELRLKGEENKLKKKELEGYGGLPAPIDQSRLPSYTLDKVVEEVETGLKDINLATNTFLANQKKDQAWLDQQKAAWTKSPTSVDPVVSNFFNTIVDQERVIQAKQEMVTQISKQVTDKYGTIEKFIPKDAPTVTYYNGNQKMAFTAKDLVNFNMTYGKYTKIPEAAQYAEGDVSSDFKVEYDDIRAKKELSPKEYFLYELFKKKDNKQKITPAEKTVLDYANKYNKEINSPYSKVLSKINEETGIEVTKRLTNSQGVSYEIPTGKTEQRKSISTVLTQFADLADQQTGGLANSPDFSSKKAREIAADPEAKFSIEVVEGTTEQEPMYKMTATGKKNNISWVINPEQKAAIFGDAYEAPLPVRAFRPLQEQIRRMGGNTTNLSGDPADFTSAYLNKTDFPVVKNYGIKADVEQTGGKYILRLNIYDPISKTWKTGLPFPRSTLTDEAGVMQAMQGLNDAAIYELLNEKPATTTDLKRLEQASKKPL